MFLKNFWFYQIDKNYVDLSNSCEEILVKERVKNIRSGKEKIFLELKDGTGQNLHVIMSRKNLEFDFKIINLDSYI